MSLDPQADENLSIKAPISQHHPDDRIFLHWFIQPELGGELQFHVHTSNPRQQNVYLGT